MARARLSPFPQRVRAGVFAALAVAAHAFFFACAGTLCAAEISGKIPPVEAEKFEVAPAAVSARGGNAEVRLLVPFARFSRDSEPPPNSAVSALSAAHAGTENSLAGTPVAWRGETVNFRFGVWAGAQTLCNPDFSRTFFLKNPNGAKIAARAVPVRWVVGQGGVQFADIAALADEPTDVPAGTLRELLVSVGIPRDAAPGVYGGAFTINLPDAENSSAKSQSFPLAVRVISASLPAERRIHLDLWQQPESVARWSGVPAWSQEHFDALRPLMLRLRALGQKAVTCAIIEEPWSHQTHDDWPSMVKWRRERDGSWSFDYTSFDAWTDFMVREIGIDGQISCYSMLPWSMEIAFFDAASGEMRTLKTDVSAPDFEKIWGAFLSDFRAHLRSRGLLEKTCIALDERPDAQLAAARRVIAQFAPELKIVSANNHPTRMSADVYDISPIFTHSGGDVPALAAERRAAGKKTTFYVCTQPERPNTFTHSAPAEARWLALYAAANGFDGFLRWAYNSWNENPFADTAFGNWPAGDCFLVYPGNRSSMRLENLRDGIEDFEKILVLRERAAAPDAPQKLKNAVAALDAFLKREFTVAAGGGNAHERQVLQAIALIESASLALPPEAFGN